MAAKLSKLKLHRLTPVLMMFAVLTFEMSTDLYLSSLPEIGAFFHVPDAAVQSTLSAYLLGFSLLGLIVGPLSDRKGRRPVLFTSMGIFALGSIYCWIAPSMTTLILARFLQGLGAGMTMVISTAILKDIYDERNFSKVLSTMGMVIALSPMIAPIIGGKIAELWGWRACFLTIAATATTIWVSSLISLEESLSDKDRKKSKENFSVWELLETYRQLFKYKFVIIYALISAVTYGGLWAWIAEAPFYFINVLGIESANFGYYYTIGPAAYILGTFINRKCVIYYGVEPMLAAGLVLMILGSALTILGTVYYPLSLTLLFIPFCIYAIGLAPVFANAVTKALSVIPSQRGGASALLTTFEMSISSLCAFIVSLLSNGTLVPCTTMMLTSSLICAFLYLTVSTITSQEAGLSQESKG